MKIGQNIKLIRSLLETDDKYKNSDNKLIATVWHKLLKKGDIDSKDITGWSLLTHLGKGDLPTPESITRCRRKLQEEIPKLRGTNWNKRHKKQEEVEKELRNITL